MFNWLSTFLLNPGLAIGSVAVASPILIHLLSRRRARRVRWAAMDFLLVAQRRNRRRIRLEQLLLLLLRCLAVLLLAMMVARPFFTPGGALASFAPSGRTERIFLLDDSYSMAYESPGGAAAGQSAFARALSAVEQIAELESRQTPGDSLTLLIASRPHAPALALPSLSEEDLRRLGDYLASLAPSQTISRMPQSLAAVGKLIRSAPTKANHVVYLMSDFQRSDWLPPDATDEQARRGVVAPLAELEDLRTSVRLVLVDVAVDDAPQNIAVTSVARGQPKIVVGVPARFEVGVSNHTRDSLDQVELIVQTADQTLPPVVIPHLAAGQTVLETISVPFAKAGSECLSVRLAGRAREADGLALDNERRTAVEVVFAVRILIVDGEPNDDRYRDEAFLLRTALRPAGRAASGNELTVVEALELDGVELDDFDVIIMANVDRLSTGAVRSIDRFVRAGGGLIVFAGDQVDIPYYNETLHAQGTGLLPASLGDVIHAEGGRAAFTLADWNTAHPVMRSFVEQLAAVLRQVRVYSFITANVARVKDSTPTQPADGEASETEIRGHPLVIASYDDDEQSPAIIERAFGLGRCILVTTSVDQEWNDWAGNFSYLPMMLELVQHAARQESTTLETLVDGTLLCPLDASIFRTSAKLRAPNYPIVPELALEVNRQPDGRLALEFDQTTRAGAYEFELTRTTGEPVKRSAAVNPDPAEADLAPATRTELTDLLGDLDFQFLDDAALLAAESERTRLEIWWPLLMAAVVVLMGEHTLAWWFGTRR